MYNIYHMSSKEVSSYLANKIKNIYSTELDSYDLVTDKTKLKKNDKIIYYNTENSMLSSKLIILFIIKNMSDSMYSISVSTSKKAKRQWSVNLDKCIIFIKVNRNKLNNQLNGLLNNKTKLVKKSQSNKKTKEKTKENQLKQDFFEMIK
jgi:hypothetical protein